MENPSELKAWRGSFQQMLKIAGLLMSGNQQTLVLRTFGVYPGTSRPFGLYVA